jgi:cytoskeletal protein RodZ
MPKHEAMAQLSRPFQIALVAVVLFAGVWLFALQGRSTTTGGAGSSATVSPSAPATTVAHKPAHTTSKAASSHTSSTRAAVAPASHKLSTSATRAPVHRAAKTVTKTATKAPSKAATRAPATTVTKAPTSTAHKGASAPATATLAGQHAVEADLAKGDVVVLLFWNPSGTDDVATHQAVQLVKKVNHVAVQEAGASQVASFGSVTRGVQVYATPTIFVIGARRQALVLTGVQDSFSVEQAIAEARSS